MDEAGADNGGQVTQFKEIKKQIEVGEEKFKDQLRVQMDENMTEMDKGEGKQKREDQLGVQVKEEMTEIDKGKEKEKCEEQASGLVKRNRRGGGGYKRTKETVVDFIRTRVNGRS